MHLNSIKYLVCIEVLEPVHHCVRFCLIKRLVYCILQTTGNLIFRNSQTVYKSVCAFLIDRDELHIVVKRVWVIIVHKITIHFLFLLWNFILHHDPINHIMLYLRIVSWWVNFLFTDSYKNLGPCEFYQEINGKCPDGYTCEVENTVPSCK